MADTQFNAQQLSNLLWSLAIMECCDRQVWDGCMAQFATLDTPPHELPDEALTQVGLGGSGTGCRGWPPAFACLALSSLTINFTRGALKARPCCVLSAGADAAAWSLWRLFWCWPLA